MRSRWELVLDGAYKGDGYGNGYAADPGSGIGYGFGEVLPKEAL